MRRMLGPFDVPLTDLEPLGTDEAGRNSYRFRLQSSNDKLIPGMECSLRYKGAEELVTIVGLDHLSIRIVCDRRLAVGREPVCLVIYPWFLYERLILALDSLIESHSHFPQSSLSAFGKHPSKHTQAPLRNEHQELNESQLAALELCCQDSIAFIWGPPGTGKTTTLAHIVEELVLGEQRVLVTSTTNAAIDQTLDALVQRPSVKELLVRGEIIRIGKSEAPSAGAELEETMERLNSVIRNHIRELNEERERLKQLIREAEDILAGLDTPSDFHQLTLFEELPMQGLDESRLSEIISDQEIPVFLELPSAEQYERLNKLSMESAARVEEIDKQVEVLEKEGFLHESNVIARSRIILATMAAVYVNRNLTSERFDAVVIEEAGMAVLPAVFYCASLAKKKVILIGDPRQLPSIVHSHNSYVQKAMARSIFDVAVPDLNPQFPHGAASQTNGYTHSPRVDSFVKNSGIANNLALLDLQYRMHPVIGNLVSELYYDGKLRTAPILEERTAIAAKEPFPGVPLALLDSGNFGRCETQQGSYSRCNHSTANLCIELSASAVADDLSSVAIITPYVEQSRFIRLLLAERKLKNVECRTVHRFQGHEKDLVILDTVDGEPFPPGVLLAGDNFGSSAANLLNVSISRARGKLIVISDIAYFRKNANAKPIGKLLSAIGSHGLVISARVAMVECNIQTI